MIVEQNHHITTVRYKIEREKIVHNYIKQLPRFRFPELKAYIVHESVSNWHKGYMIIHGY